MTGKEIKNLIAKLGLTKKEFSKKSGIGLVRLDHILNDECKPSFAESLAIHAVANNLF